MFTTPHSASTSEAERAVLTVDEVIAATGLARGTVYEAIRRGEIPSVKIRRRILVPKAAFERWLACEPVDAA